MAQILLAEPDRPIRDFIAGILTDFGHGVTSCGDGCEDEGSMLSRHCAARGIPTITLTGHEYHLDRPGQDRPPLLIDKPFRLDDLQYVVDAVAVAVSSTKAAA
jgi:hypothetical protein